MPLIRYLRENWLGVAGLIIGVIGIVASAYTFLLSKKIRVPTFVADPVRTELLSRSRVSQAPIRVTRSDGQPVTGDLTAVRFYMWNAGTESIKRDDILEPLTIVVNDKNSRILDARLTRVSRPVTAIRLSRSTSANVLSFDFRILEPGDGCTGQVIFEGRASSELLFNGTIEDARIRTAPPRRWLQASRDWTLLVLNTLTLVAGLAISFREPRTISRRRHLLLLAGITISLVVLSAAVLLTMARDASMSPAERTRRLLVTSIPDSILPPE